MTGFQESRPVLSLRTRAFFGSAIFVVLLFTTLLRLRLHASSPLPSESLPAWLAVGVAGDLAIAGVTAGLLSAAARARPSEGAARAVFSVFAVFLVLSEAFWAEVLIFLGQTPPLDSFFIGAHPTFVIRSADPRAVIGAALLVLVVGLSLAAAARRATRSGRAWFTSGRSFLASSVAVAFLLLPIEVHRRETSRHPLAAFVRLWLQKPATEHVAGYSVPQPPGDPASVRELGPARPASSYPDDRFPLAHRPDSPGRGRLPLPVDVRPNFVFLLLEGVRAEEVGAYGSRLQNVTPNLDWLSLNGVKFEQAYSTGMHTPDAELALWYGILPNPHSALMTLHPDVRLTGLPEVLRASGYRSLLWIHNGDQTFYRRDRFYLPRGFQMVDGRDFPTSDVRTSWGYSDRALARRAVKALDRAREPFAALVLTVSNHHPFRVPADARTTSPGLRDPARGFLPFFGLRVGLQTSSMVRTVHYTDEAVGDFFRMGATRPWFGRTVFVVLGDHGLSIAPHDRAITTLAGLTELRHRIPMILFSPMIGAGRVSRPVSQADIPETVLVLAGIESLRAGVGRDMLAPAEGGDARRIVTWSSEGGIVSVRGERRTYHAVVFRDSIGRISPIALEEESFFDHRADREGQRSLLPSEQAEAASYRRLARIYLEIYPWVLSSGRSGVPEDRRAGRVLTGSP